MNTVKKSIEVNAPVHDVYELWSDFSRFPSFMHNVKEVRKLGGDKWHWVAEIGGKKVEWDAQVIKNVPDREIAWKSVSGDENSGQVYFEPKGNVTRVDLRINYEPPMGIVGEMADTLTQRMSGDTEEDLKNFKKMAESQGAHTSP